MNRLLNVFLTVSTFTVAALPLKESKEQPLKLEETRWIGTADKSIDKTTKLDTKYAANTTCSLSAVNVCTLDFGSTYSICSVSLGYFNCPNIGIEAKACMSMARK
jgi:hypothetical protein